MYRNYIIGLNVLIVTVLSQDKLCMTSQDLTPSDGMWHMIPDGSVFNCRDQDKSCDQFVEMLCTNGISNQIMTGTAGTSGTSDITRRVRRRLLDHATEEQQINDVDGDVFMSSPIDDCPIFETADCPVSGGGSKGKIVLDIANFADTLDASSQKCRPLDWERMDVCNRKGYACQTLNGLSKYFCKINSKYGGCACQETIDGNPICINTWPEELVHEFGMYCNHDVDCAQFSFFGTEFGCIDQCVGSGKRVSSSKTKYTGYCMPECFFPSFPKDRFQQKRDGSDKCKSLDGFEFDEATSSCLPCCDRRISDAGGSGGSQKCLDGEMLNEAGGCSKCSSSGKCSEPRCDVGFEFDAGSGSCSQCCPWGNLDARGGCSVSQMLNDAGQCIPCMSQGTCVPTCDLGWGFNAGSGSCERCCLSEADARCRIDQVFDEAKGGCDSCASCSPP